MRAAVALILLCALVAADDMAGCGGFVKPSPELVAAIGDGNQLALNSMRVQLVSRSGVVKDETECSPKGYYFLPLYDAGDFYLRVVSDAGIAASPARVDVSFRGGASASACADDVNFQLTGFSVSGAVRAPACAGGDAAAAGGPAGLPLLLEKTDGSGQKLQAATQDGGAFTFTNVFPGDYLLSAAARSWGVQESNVPITVTSAAVRLRTPLHVSGYDVSAAVVGSDGSGMPGVAFVLLGAPGSSLPCKPPTDAEAAAAAAAAAAASISGSPLCVAQSNAAGQAMLHGVPCGSYTVLPIFSAFDVQPRSAAVTVGSSSVTVEQPFRVVGFSLHGRVVDAAGQPMSGISVALNGEAAAVTGDDGRYRLTQLSEGVATISATGKHVSFRQLSAVRLSADVAALPDIQLAAVHVCGRVNLGPGGAARTVLLADAAGGQPRDRTTTDASGAFCFDVQPGTYSLSVQVSAADRRAGIVFSPASRTVTVAGSRPVLDVAFSPASVSLSGRVSCLGDAGCSPALAVTLSPAGTGAGGDVLARTTVDAQGSWRMQGVLPGSYDVTVSHSDAAWCWDAAADGADAAARLSQTKRVQLGDDDVDGLLFTHTGFVLTTVASHPLTLRVRREGGGAAQEMALPAGTSRRCLASPGRYVLSPDACCKFQQDTLSFDTAAPAVVQLQAAKYRIQGSLQLQADGAQPSELHVAVRSVAHGAGEEADGGARITATPVGDSGRYEFVYWARFGEQLELIPEAAADLLFYPRSKSVAVTVRDCLDALTPFTARPGLFIEGSVDPPLQGVSITLYQQGGGASAGGSAAAAAAAAGNALLTVQSAADGRYRAGPLYDDVSYRVEASKPGYHFRRVGEADFVHRQLGRIEAAVADGDGQAVDGVLLSLSGDSYRNNTATRNGGAVTFTALFPGDYFLRPMLKEYVFTPSTMEVTVEEGAAAAASFTARRVAFSCYGSVRSLNGMPEAGVVISATSASGEHEETLSAEDGSFRLRGLRPGQEYTLSATTDGTNLERAAPPQRVVSMKAEDAFGFDFVVFRAPKSATLLGTVDSSRDWLPQLSVTLAAANSPRTVLASSSISFARQFSLADVAPGSYVLRLQSSDVTARGYETAPGSVTEARVTVSNAGVIKPADVRLSFDAQPRPLADDVAGASGGLYGLLLVVGAGLAFFYRDALPGVGSKKTR